MKKRKHALLLLVLFLCLSLGPSISGSGDPTAQTTIDIPALMELYNVPGVSIAVIKDFAIQRLEAYGVVDRNTYQPVTEQTLFQAASISKPVVTMAALRLVQDERMSLDENINSRLMSWSVAENQFTLFEKVTLRRLLNHSAGTTVHGFLGYQPNQTIPTLLHVLNGWSPANSPRIVVDRVPGSQFVYSGGGFCIVQQAMIDLSQKTFPQLMQETVLGPLEMQNSTFEQPPPPPWSVQSQLRI